VWIDLFVETTTEVRVINYRSENNDNGQIKGRKKIIKNQRGLETKYDVLFLYPHQRNACRLRSAGIAAAAKTRRRFRSNRNRTETVNRCTHFSHGNTLCIYIYIQVYSIHARVYTRLNSYIGNIITVGRDVTRRRNTFTLCKIDSAAVKT